MSVPNSVLELIVNKNSLNGNIQINIEIFNINNQHGGLFKFVNSYIILITLRAML